MPGKPSADRPACRGTLKYTGAPCTNRAAAGSAYCGVHGGNVRPIGRKTKLTVDVIARLVKAVEHGVTWEIAAQAIGVHPRTLLEWRTRGEEEDATGRDTVYAHLHREVTRATAAAEVKLVGVIFRSAPMDYRAAAWLLERRAPERWARKDRLDVEVARRAEPRVVEPAEESARDTILELLRAATAPPAGLEDGGPA